MFSNDKLNYEVRRHFESSNPFTEQSNHVTFKYNFFSRTYRHKNGLQEREGEATQP